MKLLTHFLGLALLLGAWPAAADDARAADHWQLLGSHQGIEAYQRDIPGQVMPAFRAVGDVEGELHEVFAVIYDVNRHKEWVHDCKDSRMLELLSDTESFIYHRIAVQWPLADRDATMRTVVTVEKPGEQILLRFTGKPHSKMPPVSGVSRMASIEGHYRLTKVGDKRTRVEYQVVSDPGVNAPKQLVVLQAREIPLRTILGLRRQVQRTRGSYDEFIQRWRKAASTTTPDPAAGE